MHKFIRLSDDRASGLWKEGSQVLQPRVQQEGWRNVGARVPYGGLSIVR